MAREQRDAPRTEASLFDRRDFLRAAGVFAGGTAFASVADRTAADGTAVSADVGSVSVDHDWETVRLSDSSTDPVVLAPSLPHRGPQPASPRIRNVTGSAFEIAVEEWRYLDGFHRDEPVGFVALSPGRYALPTDAELEVGLTATDHRWTSTEFSSSFSTTPVVFSNAQTVAGPQPIVTRHRDVSPSGMAVRVQEEEAEGPHRVEDVGYLAVEPGSGTLDGRAFEAGVRPGVDDGWWTIEFDRTFTRPVFLADMQTFRGSNTCAVRYRNLSGSSVEVTVEEERSRDSETAHLAERIGYLVVEGAENEQSPDGDTPLSELDRGRVEKLVHRYVNERRAAHDLETLAFDTELREIARYHSEDMAENDYFSHVSPSGETMSDRYDKFGYDCRAYTSENTYYTGAENIAYTYYDTDVRTENGTERYTNADELARGIVRGWMNSQGHRENILTAAWNNEGIGIAITSGGKVYATQNFC